MCLFLTVVPPPPDVNITATGKSTATVTWTARSGVLQYEVVVTDTDTNNPPVTTRTSATHLDISNLEPCSNYTVGVSSLNSFLIPGEPNEVSHLTSGEYILLKNIKLMFFSGVAIFIS